MVKKARMIAGLILCLLIFSQFMHSTVNAQTTVNFEPHYIGAGATMYYWDGPAAISANEGAYMDLSSEFGIQANVRGGYRDMSKAQDEVLATAQNVGGYSFYFTAPRNSTYRMFTTNLNNGNIYVVTGHITY